VSLHNNIDVIILPKTTNLHAKLVIIPGKNLVGVGSANLTSSGLHNNIECWVWLSGVDYVREALGFVTSLTGRAITVESWIPRCVKQCTSVERGSPTHLPHPPPQRVGSCLVTILGYLCCLLSLLRAVDLNLGKAVGWWDEPDELGEGDLEGPSSVRGVGVNPWRQAETHSRSWGRSTEKPSRRRRWEPRNHWR